MRKKLVLGVLLLSQTLMWAQGPNQTGRYYATADGTKGKSLKTALHQIIKNPDVDSYDQLWVDYKYSDVDRNGYIMDLYSIMSYYEYYTHQQGVVKVTSGNAGEGICYNREHSMPKSWFGGIGALPMATDLMHVFPTDYYVNSRRNNYPYGTTSGEKFTSYGGFSKFGKSTNTAYDGLVFEPNKEYKGDLARVYFYMATCYENDIPTWTSVTSSASNKVQEIFSGNAHTPFVPWVMELLMKWAKEDPVSQKEIDRNNMVYRIQGNRNPFVDFPGLEEYVWGKQQQKVFRYGNYAGAHYTSGTITEPTTPFDASTVKASKGTQTYEKVDYSGDLELGASYLIVNETHGQGMGDIVVISKKTQRSPMAVEINGDRLTTKFDTGYSPHELILGGKRGEYTLYDPATGSYLALNAAATQLDVETSRSSNTAKWSIKFDKGNVKIKNVAFPEYFICYNTTASNPRFSTCKSSSRYNAYPQLYKKVDSLRDATAIDNPETEAGSPAVEVYTLQGVKVRTAASYAEAMENLPQGLYIVNGKKVRVQ